MLALQSKLGSVRSTSIVHKKVLRTSIFQVLNVWWNLPVMSSGFLVILFPIPIIDTGLFSWPFYPCVSFGGLFLLSNWPISLHFQICEHRVFTLFFYDSFNVTDQWLCHHFHFWYQQFVIFYFWLAWLEINQWSFRRSSFWFRWFPYRFLIFSVADFCSHFCDFLYLLWS